jgi:aspartyl/asparaginyl beta-hydroxylase (cupin superfamily)
MHIMIPWYDNHRNARRSQKFKGSNNRCVWKTRVVEQVPGDYQHICSVFNHRGS